MRIETGIIFSPHKKEALKVFFKSLSIPPLTFPSKSRTQNCSHSQALQKPTDCNWQWQSHRSTAVNCQWTNGPMVHWTIDQHTNQVSLLLSSDIGLDFKLIVVDPAAHKSWPLKLSTLYLIVHIKIQKVSKPLGVAPVLHNTGMVLGTMSHGQIMVEMFKWWSHGRLVSLSEGHNAYKIQCATFF